MKFSPVIFGAVYCIAYVAVLSVDAALFKYYPQTEQFCWGWERIDEAGPSMAWYGLMANAGIAALIFAVIIPGEKIAAAMRNKLWLFPFGAMIGCLYLMRIFFFR